MSTLALFLPLYFTLAALFLSAIEISLFPSLGIPANCTPNLNLALIPFLASSSFGWRPPQTDNIHEQHLSPGHLYRLQQLVYDYFAGSIGNAAAATRSHHYCSLRMRFDHNHFHHPDSLLLKYSAGALSTAKPRRHHLLNPATPLK